MSEFFKKLKKGLEEAIAYEEGELDLLSEIIEVTEPVSQNKTEKNNHDKKNY